MSEPFHVSPARVMEEAAHLLGTSFSDIVPPQAQTHLLNAQRELLLALAVTIEHHTSRASGQRRRRSGTAAKSATKRPRKGELD